MNGHAVQELQDDRVRLHDPNDPPLTAILRLIAFLDAGHLDHLLSKLYLIQQNYHILTVYISVYNIQYVYTSVKRNLTFCLDFFVIVI